MFVSLPPPLSLSQTAQSVVFKFSVEDINDNTPGFINASDISANVKEVRKAQSAPTPSKIKTQTIITDVVFLVGTLLWFHAIVSF